VFEVDVEVEEVWGRKKGRGRDEGRER